MVKNLNQYEYGYGYGRLADYGILVEIGNLARIAMIKNID